MAGIEPGPPAQPQERYPLRLCLPVEQDLTLLQEQNADYYSQYVTEDIADYIERKRYLGVHGNHLEIQAMSELYNRPIHIYCYSTG